MFYHDGVLAKITAYKVYPAAQVRTSNDDKKHPAIEIYYSVYNLSSDSIVADDVFFDYFIAVQNNDPNVTTPLNGCSGFVWLSNVMLGFDEGADHSIEPGGVGQGVYNYDLSDSTTPVKLMAYKTDQMASSSEAPIGSILLKIQ